MNDVEIVIKGDNQVTPTFIAVRKEADATAASVKDSFTKLDKPLNAAGIAAGAVFAIGLGTAVGAGLLTLGIGSFLLRENPAVQSAATSLGETASSAFGDAAEPMAGALVTSLQVIEGAVSDFQPMFQQAFGAAAGYLAPLTSGLVGLVGNLLPGFVSMLKQAQPVFNAIGDALPDIGAAVGNLFDAVGDIAPTVAGMLTVVLDSVSLGINVLAELLRILGPMAPLILTVVGALKLVAPVMAAITVATKLMNASFIATPWGLLAAGALSLGFALGGLIDSLSESDDKAGGAAKKFTVLDDVMGILRSETVQGFASMIQYNQAIDAIIANTQRATRGAIDWEASLDDVTESVKRNGRSLDIGTEKGRANANSLLNAADAAVQMRQANIANGMSADKANAAYKQQIDRLYAVGKGAGFAEDQLNDLVGNYRVDFVIRTQLTGAVKSLGGFGGFGGFGAVLNAIDNMPKKASGGIAGGLTWVGENGKELVNLPQGSHVYSAPQSQSMAAARGGTGTSGGTQVIVSAAPGADQAFIDMILGMLRFEVKTNGGNVQETFGQGV